MLSLKKMACYMFCICIKLFTPGNNVTSHFAISFQGYQFMTLGIIKFPPLGHFFLIFCFILGLIKLCWCNLHCVGRMLYRFGPSSPQTHPTSYALSSRDSCFLFFFFSPSLPVNCVSVTIQPAKSASPIKVLSFALFNNSSPKFAERSWMGSLIVSHTGESFL